MHTYVIITYLCFILHITIVLQLRKQDQGYQKEVRIINIELQKENHKHHFVDLSFTF